MNRILICDGKKILVTTLVEVIGVAARKACFGAAGRSNESIGKQIRKYLDEYGITVVDNSARAKIETSQQDQTVAVPVLASLFVRYVVGWGTGERVLRKDANPNHIPLCGDRVIISGDLYNVVLRDFSYPGKDQTTITIHLDQIK